MPRYLAWYAGRNLQLLTLTGEHAGQLAIFSFYLSFSASSLKLLLMN